MRSQRLRPCSSSMSKLASRYSVSLFSVPNRYMHSQVEMCDLRDAEAAVDLLVETIAGFTGSESFVPVR